MEYMVFMIIVIGALVAMRVYIKRGIQGRWREAVNDFGDQYDPMTASTSVTHAMNAVIQTDIIVSEVPGGFETLRTDTGNTTETRSGTLTVGASVPSAP